MKEFTFAFTGKNAEVLKERFFAYFWDGGLEDTIEEKFLKEFGLSIDDIDWGENGNPVIKTDNARI